MQAKVCIGRVGGGCGKVVDHREHGAHADPTHVVGVHRLLEPNHVDRGRAESGVRVPHVERLLAVHGGQAEAGGGLRHAATVAACPPLISWPTLSI